MYLTQDYKDIVEIFNINEVRPDRCDRITKNKREKMKILARRTAGFIGSHLALRLLKRGNAPSTYAYTSMREGIDKFVDFFKVKL